MTNPKRYDVRYVLPASEDAAVLAAAARDAYVLAKYAASERETLPPPPVPQQGAPREPSGVRMRSREATFMSIEEAREYLGRCEP